MEIRQQLKSRIQQIEKHIADLKQVQNSDTGASYKEASQTNDLIINYERQVHNLKEELVNLDESYITYILLSDSGIERVFTLVNKGADPFTSRISIGSPLGQT